MKSRYEKWLEAIANGEQITEEPVCRREIFLKAIANKEGTANLPEPMCREEEMLRAVAAGETISATPTCRREEMWKAIANNEPIPSSSAFSIEEKLFKQIHEAEIGGGSGSGGDIPIIPTEIKYTVTFDEGITVMDGDTQIASGDQIVENTSLVISYTLTDGYELTSFQVNGVDATNNSTITITSDTTITFTEEASSSGGDTSTFSRTFSENTPAQISAVANVISANNMTSTEVESTYGWKIGDTISYTLTTGENVEMRIIGFCHDDLSDGSGKAGITLEMTHCLRTLSAMSPFTKGYLDSYVKLTYLPEVEATIPLEWRNIIKPVNKYIVSLGESDRYVETSSETLFLLASPELSYDSSPWVRYEYWSSVYTNNQYVFEKQYDKDGDGTLDTVVYWWTNTVRGSQLGYASEFIISPDAGSAPYATASSTLGVSYAFCIGGGTTTTTYTITFGSGVKVLKGSTSITSGTKVESGTQLTISYTLTDNYHLVAFQVNGVDATNNSTITITSDTTITFTEEASSSGGDAPVTYGVKIDKNNSDPETSVTYTDDAVGFDKSYMNFNTDTFNYGSWQDKFPFNQIKPCILKDGVVTKYLNSNNYAEDIDGNAVDITTACDGDVMIEIPKIYYRLYQDDNYQYIQISNTAQDGFCCLAHTYKGVEKDKVYIGAYHGYYDNNTLRSVSGVSPSAKITLGDFRNYARANGQCYGIFYWNLLVLIQSLYTIQFKNLNCQSALGYGGRITTDATLPSSGNTDTKGLYYGTETIGHMKILGIEDLWCGGGDMIDGIIIDSDRRYLIADVTQASIEYNDNGTDYTIYDCDISDYNNKIPTKIFGTSELGFIASDGITDASDMNIYYCDWQSRNANGVVQVLGHQNSGIAGIYSLSSTSSSGFWGGVTRLVYCV